MKCRNTLCLLLLAGTLANTHGQLIPQFATRFGWNGHDGARSLVVTSDGGFATLGHSNSFGDYQVLLVKFNANGQVLWFQTYGGPAFDRTWGPNSLDETSDGGFIIAAETWSYGVGNGDFYLIRTDSNGNVLWTKTFGGLDYDRARSVEQTADGGFIVSGLTFSFGVWGNDVYLVKTDAQGNLEWEKTIGVLDYETAHTTRQTSDGGYIITGIAIGGYAQRFLMLKTDAFGNVEWVNTDYATNGNDVRETSDGGFLFVGGTGEYQGRYWGPSDVLLIKTDQSGSVQWVNSLGGSAFEIGITLAETPGNEFFITGYTTAAPNGLPDFLLIKTDAFGNQLWNQNYGSPVTDGLWGSVGLPTADGGFVVAGETVGFGATGQDIYLFKLINPVDTLIQSAVDNCNVTLGQGDSTLSDTVTVSFSGTSSVGISGYLCRLDGGVSAPCSSPHTIAGLSVGTHTLEISAVDSYGHADPTPAVFVWQVVTLGDALSTLIQHVQKLQSSNVLNQGQANSLLQKLNAASNTYASSPTAAKNQLNSFVNEITGWVGSVLTQSEAQALLDAVAQILCALGP